MFIKLYNDSKEEREDPNYALNALCKYYKSDCYYWEFIILSRRILITLYAIFWTLPWFPIVLVILLSVYTYLHHQYQPFKTKEANIFEYILICCTSFVVFIQSTATYVDSISYMASAVLALFILIPILAVFIYIIIMIIRVRQNPQLYKFKSSAPPMSIVNTVSTAMAGKMSTSVPLRKSTNTQIRRRQKNGVAVPVYASTSQYDEDSDEKTSGLDMNDIEYDDDDDKYGKHKMSVEMMPKSVDNATYSVKKMLSANMSSIEFTPSSQTDRKFTYQGARYRHNKSLEEADDDESVTTPLNQTKSTSIHL